MAGVVLDRINHWSRYGKAKIPGVEGQWCANDRPWWMREACLSPGQLDRSIAKLAKLGLIEKRQSPFAGRNVLHMRPSASTKDILASATTWSMALEVLAHTSIPIPAWLSKSGTQIVPSLQDMIEAWGKESLTATEVGKLARYRQEMKSAEWGQYDCSKITLPLIDWAINHWTNFLTACKAKGASTKDASKPSVAFFCDNFGVALNLAMLELESEGSSQPGTDVCQDPFDDELEPVI